jgi:hypothetical protein
VGDYSILYFADHDALEMKNRVWPIVMSMFGSEDKEINKRFEHGEDEDDWYEDTEFKYSSSVAKAIRRLEVQGFSLRKARRAFEDGISALLIAAEMYAIDSEDDETRKDESLEKHFKTWKDRQVFRELNFDIWLQCMKEIFSKKISRWHVDESLASNNVDAKLIPYIRFILHDDFFDDHNILSCFYYGFPVFWYDDFEDGDSDFPYADMRLVFRSMLAACSEDDNLTVDCSDLLNRSLSEDDDLCRDIEKIIILVEGSTDKDVLGKTILALYPELSVYYSILDFRTLNIGGGSGTLVQILKIFVSGGIRNRIIAVFDNDTAANDALRSLAGISLSENVRIITLPPIEFARQYPTIGPQGSIQVDVNGLACSIEMYFGNDVLMGENGKLTPIQWGGYFPALKQYQGEILNKKRLQEKYLALMDAFIIDPQQQVDHDWEPMKLVLEQIFAAFT